MGFALQLKLLLWKNFTLKKRKPIVLLFELVIPLVLFFILIGIRKKQPAYPANSIKFPAFPLPSAGVISVMQAFCDNGVHNEHGFAEFPNSTITPFLSKLNNVSQDNNFFKPGFTPNDMDEIPEIYRSILEDPVAIHDCFVRASDAPIGSLVDEKDNLEEFLVNDLALPHKGVDILLNSSLDMGKIYQVIFGIQDENDILLDLMAPKSLGHLNSLVTILQKNEEDAATIYRMVLWLLDSSTTKPPPKFNLKHMATEIRDLLLMNDNLRTVFCDNSVLWQIIVPDKAASESAKYELQQSFCNLNETQMSSLTTYLKTNLKATKLVKILNLEQWNITEAKFRFQKLVKDLKKFAEFEMTLSELSYLASALPQDACNSINTTDESFNETYIDNVPNKKKQFKPQYGLLRIWLGMQKTICGKESNLKQPLNFDNEEINLDDLGMSKYQKEQLGILVHVLYSNPKVLYAPNKTAADNIIQKANETFQLLDIVTQYSQKMLNISEEIREFLAQNSTDHSLEVLQKIRVNLRRFPRLLKLFRSEPLEKFAEGSLIVDKETFLSELEAIDNAACSWKSILSGLSLNIFKGFENEADLLTYFKHHAYYDNVTVLASVIFNLEPNGTLPNHLTYRIRQNASFTTTTNLIRNRFWFPGPRNWGYNYYQFGFVWIQDILERAMISLYTNKDVIEPGTYVHQFPYPCYIQDQFLFMIEHVMPLCLAISWVYSVAMLVQSIVYEKEQRLKEVMKTMGLNSAVHWLAWFITSFIQMSITAACLTLILKYGQVLTYSNPILIFLILEIFVVANIAFSFLVSVVYSKAKLAAACAGIIYFLTYVPYMYIAVREEAAHDHISGWIKRLACLFSTTSFGLGAKYFAFYEEIGVGVQWSNLKTSPVEDDEFTLWDVAMMMIWDSVMYFVLVWYIENVHPGSYGLPKPWYFPFTKNYWFKSTKPETDCKYLSKFKKQPVKIPMVEDEQVWAMSNQVDSKYFEPYPERLPLGVCIDNLVKHYKSGNKLAVNKLSLNLYEGQITSFLGHNGAGKTTTMSILTGLFPPTDGRAIIYGHDIRTEMDQIRQSLGMCPQHNVLFDDLTVEEHLWFYSSLKNTPQNEIKTEMEKMVADLNLPMKKVAYLSGGMKRKLSVAIAFVGGSQTVILDEPTAGVDPYSRRAIWDLLLKYKAGRTILLSTHHMDEADMLGDRIAIISNGQLQCCGSPLFLKNNLGEGYHLYMVKKLSPGLDSWGMEHTHQIKEFVYRYVPSSRLLSESKHELHFILPLVELKCGNYEKLFQALEQNQHRLNIESYGVKNTTLEEVFLKVAVESQFGKEKEIDQMENKAASLNGFSHSVNVPEENNGFANNSDVKDVKYWHGHRKQLSEDGNVNYYKLEQLGSKKEKTSAIEGLGQNRLQGKLLYLRQFIAILTKRFWCTKRNTKGIVSQILLPAFFVSVAMSVALTAPKLEDLPPLVLSPSQYYNYTQPEGNIIPYSNNRQDLRDCNAEHCTTGGDSEDLVRTLKFVSGVGATCVLQNAFNNTFDVENLNFSVRNYELLSQHFEPECGSVFVPGLPLGNFVPPPPTSIPPHLYTTWDYNFTHHTTVAPKERLYPYCHCADDRTGFVCEPYGYKQPESFKVVTGDILLDITGQNEHEYYLYTTDAYRLRRYGAFSFGLVRDYVPAEFGKNAPALFRKIAVRNAAKVWYNNKGFHSLPTYINSLNNAILRGNLPREMGNPAAYGITVINHPMTDTSYMLSKDQIIQGTDVLIAIFIIVAMSFVPASFVLFLVYERYTHAKHLQTVSGVGPLVYWVANYFWDMCSYVVPATCCVLILQLFDIPAYSSKSNFPAVVSLFLMYGWSITPVMYPVSFLFKEPSTAYIFLIVINLFVGITCVVTSFLLEVFSYDPYLKAVHHLLKNIFLIFPNYCLGRGLMDIAFNEYQNFFFLKTGQYDKMQSPFALNLVTKNLIAMAISGLAFFCLTLALDYIISRKPKYLYKEEESLLHTDYQDEDFDVKKEKNRVLAGNTSKDILKLVNLTKVYETKNLGKHLAVDRLCLGVPEGECLGLLGVNGAGKTTTFKMLTGDLSITAGDAFIYDYSLRNNLDKIQQFIGYCPQFDALYDELTGREHLTLYARFRGIPSKNEKEVVDWALKKLDLMQYADKLSGTYSGGNKRKLSTAISLLGSPPVIYLDEPTTGMDPHTRRFLWDLITELVQSGRSVVLTSHSMEECEALCTRLAIMVNGTLRCLGSIQHLKDRFGEGYSITVRTHSPDMIDQWMLQTFPDAYLKEQHFNLFQYEIRSENISLAYVFSKLEWALKELQIEEYSVCQNTLDNVFINFVKHQNDRGALQ